MACKFSRRGLAAIRRSQVPENQVAYFTFQKTEKFELSPSSSVDSPLSAPPRAPQG